MKDQVWYLGIGSYRGKRRIWIEGARLLRAGVAPGEPMSVVFDDDQKVIRVSVGVGGRRVSSRKRNGQRLPIIDICNSLVATVFGRDIKRVRVQGAAGELEISIHPDEVAQKRRCKRGQSALNGCEPVRIGSIFHGAGVLDGAVMDGLRSAGKMPRLEWAVEAEASYLDASVANNPCWAAGGRAIQARVEEVDLEDFSEVDILLAGIPCTGASLAGRSKNRLAAAEHHETAGSLFVATLQAIKAAQPAVVVLENVPAYASTLSMHVIRDVLDTWGYHVHETVLNGADFGAIEARSRLVVVATTKGLEFDLSWVVPRRQSAPRLAEVLEPVADDAPCWRRYEYLVAKERSDRSAGKGFRMQVVTPDATSVGVIGRGYAKVRSTEPKLAHPDKPGLMRQFTPVEHARIKGVPERMIAGLSATVAHEALGQSVVYPVFQAVGKALARCVRSAAGAMTQGSSTERQPDLFAV